MLPTRGGRRAPINGGLAADKSRSRRKDVTRALSSFIIVVDTTERPKGLPVARAYASGVVPASADKVWALVRDFNGMPDWHPAIKGSEIEDGTNLVCGAVRKLDLGGGAAVRERLVTLDDVDRTYTYEFTDPGPFPVRTYRSTIRVAPVTDTGDAFIEWSCWFDSEGADEPGMVRQYSDGVYAAGIEALRRRFAP
jgi:hypothetical protein